LPVLAAAGWHAVAPDLHGYGDSNRPQKLEAYAIDHVVADAAALFDAFSARRRPLVAYDWGAVIAWTFAMRKTRPLDGLIVMNVPHPAVFRVVRSFLATKGALLVCRLFPTSLASRAGLDRVSGTCGPQCLSWHGRRQGCVNALRPGAMTAMIKLLPGEFLQFPS
jgi:pimeloyl-ACP methyl ester carboxylesterase